ncbi:hypothetical protein EYR36_004567 [Pleurotus pulmonarius]|nr:hypothetical protein EYR36_004567 [Pleurotus pulmonarius]
MNPPERPGNEPHTPGRLHVQDGPRLSVELSSPISPGLRRSSFTNHIKSTPRSRASQDVRDRSRIGYQNMIIQSFQELQARSMPLPIFKSLKIQEDEASEDVFGAIVDSVKGVVKLKESLDSSQKARTFDEELDDAADGGEHGFDTKQTHHLLSNLWTIIKQSDDSGAYVFDDGPQSQDRSSMDQKFASSFRRSRHSLSPSGRRSRSPSPSFTGNAAQGSELLMECISMLSSIVMEDCRFKYRPISLTHPPNALQALVLLIARFLVFKHRRDNKIVHLLLVALTPSFSTFGKEMHLRLLSLFEEIVVIILETIDQSVDVRGQEKANANIVVTDDQHPSVSIQVESFDRDDAKPLMRWTPWGSGTSHPPTVLSTNAPSHQLSVYYSSSALVTLLASIFSAIGTGQDSEARPEVLHRLHHIVDLVSWMKHDLYMDLLEVVASQPIRARYAAVSFLTTLWPAAVGHSSLSCPFPVTSYPPTTPRVSPYDHQFDHRNNPEGLNSCSREDYTSDSLEIKWSDLRQSCVDHYDDLLMANRDHLSEKTYEELDVFLTMLFIQKQILDNGIAMGSIVIRQRGKLVAQQDAPALDSFELHHVITWCEDLISSRNGDVSPGLDEYLVDNGVHPTQFLITCEWTSLLYIASVIKAPRATNNPAPSDTLIVPILPDSSSDDNPTHPNEVVTLSQLRDTLGYDFHLFSDHAAKHVLSLLQHLGFFYESRFNPDIFSGDPQETYCIFPLPLGLDLSINVELLFSSIEASLSDLDLSVNEFGFLILTRKLWPDGLLSNYAHKRLCRSILCWILAEDASLAAILRDFLARQKPLPGTRSAMESHPWPYTQDSRPSPSGSANNGGDYIATRRGMLSRYACRWLRALHDQSPPQYAVLLFDLAREIAETEKMPISSLSTGNRATYDRTLSNIAGFMRASATFTVGDGLFSLWLESLLPDCVYSEPMPSLLRLLPKEVDSFQRTSVFLDVHSQQDVSTPSIEPWRAVVKTAQENVEGLQRGLKWLHVLVRSGVDVPALTFGQICGYALDYDTPFEDIHFFIETIFTSLWLRSLGRQSLQRIVARLWSKCSSTVWDNLRSAAQLETR